MGISNEHLGQNILVRR